MIKNGYFHSFDNTKLFYTVEGPDEETWFNRNTPKTKPTLLFCYGLVCSKLHWSYQIDYLKNQFNTIWFDYRGHHRSDFPKDPNSLTIENIAKDIEALLKELDVQNVVLLGHSMGVNLVLEAYRRFPERISKLVLANGTARGPLASMFHTNIAQIVFPYLYASHKKFPRLSKFLWKAQGNSKIVPWIIGQLGFNPHLSKPEDVELYVDMLSKLEMIVTLQLLKDYEDYDATHWLSKIDVPTLIIAGEKDLIIPPDAQEMMHQLIPNSRFEMIRNGSHCPQMDLPELINVILESFLKNPVE